MSKEPIAETILLEYEIEAEARRVFDALTAEIGNWWTHTFKDVPKIVFEPRVGGRFYEDWGNETGALYATVTYIDPPYKLKLSGPMGMPGAVACVMEFELKETGGRTRVALIHDIFGAVGRDTVESYRSGWKEILGSTLKAYIEGRRE